jgi:hypothetical protein
MNILYSFILVKLRDKKMIVVKKIVLVFIFFF